MIGQDPHLEQLLRRYGKTLSQATKASPELFRQIMSRRDANGPQPPRMLVQLLATSAMLIVGIAALAIALHQRTAPSTALPRSSTLGPPPPGRPLIWYSVVPPEGTTVSHGTAVALGWDGQVKGELSAPNVSQAPDGSRLFIPGIGITDQAGRPLGQAPVGKGGLRWSDDSRDFCVTANANGAQNNGATEPAWLYVGTTNGPMRQVTQFGTFGGQSTVAVEACSVLNDRAILTQLTVSAVTQVRVIRLSTGATLFEKSYSPPVTWDSASPDGRYLAELSEVQSIIRRTSDGSVVARLQGQKVLAFSWDDNRVITLPIAGNSSANEARLVDWSQERVLWRLPLAAGAAEFAPAYALAEPGGSRMVFSIGQPNVYGKTDGLWLLADDGTARKIVSGTISPGW